MLRFTVRRLLQLIPILLGLSIILFAWIRALPGGPAVALLGERATPERIAQINEIYGLNDPVWQQYLKFLGRALHGDLGVSVKTQRPVMEEWTDRFPATIELAVTAGLIAVLIGVPLGYMAARSHGGAFDNFAVMGSLLGVAIPVFFLAYMLKYVFAVQLGWFPASGRQDPRLFSDHPTGFYILDGLITGRPDAAWDATMHLILPAVASGQHPVGGDHPNHASVCARCRSRGLRADGGGQGTHPTDHLSTTYPSQRVAARLHGHRPPSRPPAGRGSSDRDGVRFRWDREIPGREY